MSKNGTRYSEEFKQQIDDLYNSGSSVSYLSSEYGVTNVTIYSWIKQLPPVKVSEKEEINSIGYAYDTSMTAELAMQAAKNACLNVKVIEGIILHSDLGTQYTSRIFEDYLSFKGIIHSFSRKGNPYDNACIESFHSVLKKEEINHHKYNDFNTARKAVFEYIESWYNRKRIHGAINYLTRRLLMKQHKRHQKLNFLCLHY
ncbi:hypothetical protein GCM10023142_38690 [Anaerocolumna aminovalerica]|uniref:integrase core domain-containing protein n=1 Tax=Anaerocolumna aminovalerica TaxID=1527 RepID=UPI001C0F1B24|nr:integrase core domain-containing protein [Anaerocolumna aminovalerica]MBU5331376.1 DDE-type integrase/transposase/recombinase [Anaerocolumna aminovalerica]